MSSITSIADSRGGNSMTSITSIADSRGGNSMASIADSGNSSNSGSNSSSSNWDMRDSVDWGGVSGHNSLAGVSLICGVVDVGSLNNLLDGVNLVVDDHVPVMVCMLQNHLRVLLLHAGHGYHDLLQLAQVELPALILICTFESVSDLLKLFLRSSHLISFSPC